MPHAQRRARRVREPRARSPQARREAPDDRAEARRRGARALRRRSTASSASSPPPTSATRTSTTRASTSSGRRRSASAWPCARTAAGRRPARRRSRSSASPRGSGSTRSRIRSARCTRSTTSRSAGSCTASRSCASGSWRRASAGCRSGSIASTSTGSGCPSRRRRSTGRRRTISAAAASSPPSPRTARCPGSSQAEGPDVVCYASDYYHWDSVFPDSVKILAERADLDARALERLFAGNAARLYGLPMRGKFVCLTISPAGCQIRGIQGGSPCDIERRDTAMAAASRRGREETCMARRLDPMELGIPRQTRALPPSDSSPRGASSCRS